MISNLISAFHGGKFIIFINIEFSKKGKLRETFRAPVAILHAKFPEFYAMGNTR